MEKMNEGTNTVFAQRLANARKMRCLSQRELSERLDIQLSANAQALSNELITPAKAASLLGVEVDSIQQQLLFV